MSVDVPFMLPPPIVVELAGIPQGKGRPRFSRRTGNAYTPEGTRDYEFSLRLAAQKAMEGKVPLDGPVQVRVQALLPVPVSWSERKRKQALAGVIRPTSRPDWENIAKMLDAFNEIVWRDDRQVVDGRVVKRYSDRPALRIEVEAA